MPVRSYGNLITRNRPGRWPRWTRAQITHQLKRLERDYKGPTLSKTRDVWLDLYPRKKFNARKEG